jgi:hypothetical protein
LVESINDLPISEFNAKVLDYLIDFKGTMLFNDDVTFLTTRFH